MPDAELRPATTADAAAVAQIWREGWRDGHLGHVPAALVAARTRSAKQVTRWRGSRSRQATDRARRFYERCGWSDEGSFDYSAAVGSGSTPVPCHRYTRRTSDLKAGEMGRPPSRCSWSDET